MRLPVYSGPKYPLHIVPVPGYWSCFALAHRAVTAFLALSLRWAGVSFLALAGPPFRPPLRPRATAIGFLRLPATKQVYVSGPGASTIYFQLSS
jgi:hypothetical protein